METLALQSVVRGTAFLALLTLLPADARLYAEPLERSIPVQTDEGDESQRKAPAPALVQTIPDLDVRRTAAGPGDVEIQSESDGTVDTTGPTSRLRFPRLLSERCPASPIAVVPQCARPAIQPHGPPCLAFDSTRS